MATKPCVAILCGGRSAEHEVSLLSARNVIAALDRTRYDAVAVGIGKDGVWRAGGGEFLEHADDPARVRLREDGEDVLLVRGAGGGALVAAATHRRVCGVDVVFPVLHGTHGEDGTVQGLVKLLGLPCVGAGVLGSAAGMDKEVTKRLLRDAGLPIADFAVIDAPDRHGPHFASLSARFGLPLFVKPANMGSSVGVSKVRDAAGFAAALDEAFRFDTKVIVEEFIAGREIECAVLGNERPEASVPGEILPAHDFYSYEAKYIDEQGAALKVPAEVDADTADRIRRMAVESFRAICCEGMARVDFFLRPDGRLVVNELNTIPGFTKISMYPRLWAATGVPYGELIDRLIRLAVARHERDAALETSYTG